MSEIFLTNSWHFADKKILETLGWSIPRRTGQNQGGVSGDMFDSDAMLCWSGSFDYLDAIWFLMVTCSTVGYGDVSPKTVLGKVAVMFFLCSKLHFFTFYLLYRSRLKSLGIFNSKKNNSFFNNPDEDFASVKKFLLIFNFLRARYFKLKL